MAVLPWVGGWYTGLSSDTKPAGPSGWRFLETNTGNVYYHNGTSWVLIIVSGGNVSTTSSNTYGDFDQIFRSGRIKIRNPADNQSYSLVGSAIAAARNITLPLLTADDTLVTLAFAQTLTNKTLTTPTISSILNSGTLSLPTGTDTLVARATTDTLTNKTISASSNTINRVSQDPFVKRTGAVVPTPSATTTATAVGTAVRALKEHVLTGAGTNTTSFDTTEGLVANFVATATGGLNIGIVSPVSTTPLCRTLFNGYMRFRGKIDSTTSSRFYVGFVGVNTLPISDTPMASAVPGVMVGWSSTDTLWTIYQNDNVGTVTKTNITGSIAKDANYHTIEISWGNSATSIDVTFDGVNQNLSSNIPLTTSDLWFNAVGQTTTTTARTFSVHSTWTEFGK